jgi:hypothetical protein
VAPRHRPQCSDSRKPRTRADASGPLGRGSRLTATGLSAALLGWRRGRPTAARVARLARRRSWRSGVCARLALDGRPLVLVGARCSARLRAGARCRCVVALRFGRALAALGRESFALRAAVVGLASEPPTPDGYPTFYLAGGVVWRSIGRGCEIPLKAKNAGERRQKSSVFRRGAVFGLAGLRAIRPEQRNNSESAC